MLTFICSAFHALAACATLYCDLPGGLRVGLLLPRALSCGSPDSKPAFSTATRLAGVSTSTEDSITLATVRCAP